MHFTKTTNVEAVRFLGTTNDTIATLPMFEADVWPEWLACMINGPGNPLGPLSVHGGNMRHGAVDVFPGEWIVCVNDKPLCQEFPVIEIMDDKRFNETYTPNPLGAASKIKDIPTVVDTVKFRRPPPVAASNGISNNADYDTVAARMHDVFSDDHRPTHQERQTASPERLMLISCRDQFDEYAKHHSHAAAMASGQSRKERQDKANRNLRMVEMINEVLNRKAEPGYVVTGAVYEAAVKGRADFRQAYRECLPVVRAATALVDVWARHDRPTFLLGAFNDAMSVVVDALASFDDEPLSKEEADDALDFASGISMDPPVISGARFDDDIRKMISSFAARYNDAKGEQIVTIGISVNDLHRLNEMIIQPEFSEVDEAPTATDETSLRGELEVLLNKRSAENGSNTPDFILANMLVDVLGVFNVVINDRERWYDLCCVPGGAHTNAVGHPVTVTPVQTI